MTIANTLGISTADDLAEMIDDIGATLVFGDDTLTVTVGPESKVRSIDPEADVNEYTISCSAVKSDFTVLPSVVEGDSVTLDGVIYSVGSIDTDELKEIVLLTLMRKDDG